MSIGLIWLIIIILIPLVGFYLLRINAATVFLSLCLGYVLFAFDSHNASMTANNLISHNYLPIHVTASVATTNLFLLLAPAVLSIILQLGSLTKHKRIINILPSLGVSLFLPLLIVPLLPTSIMISIVHTSFWSKITTYQSSIVGISALVAIIFFWLTVHNKREKTKHHGSKTKS